MRAFATVVSLVLGCLLPPAGAVADSIFSANGLGETIYPTDVRGRGMGTVSIAVDDVDNMAVVNPALLANVTKFTLHAEGTPEVRRVEDADNRVQPARSTNFPLLRLGIRVPRFGVVGLAIGQYNDVSYVLKETAELSGLSFDQTLEGRNGWSYVALTYATALPHNVKVGADINFLVGSFDDVWTSVPSDPQQNTTVDSLIVNHSRGPLLRLGALWAPYERLKLGISFMPPRGIDLRTEVRGVDGLKAYKTDRITLPMGIGGGISAQLGAHWVLASDLYWTRWEDTDIQLARRSVQTRNTTRIAFGAEYKSDRTGEGRSLFSQIGWRAGYYQEQWNYIDPFGESIHDHFVSIGAGIPFPKQAGAIDLSIEAGTRGSVERNRAREQILRIGLGITLKEVVEIGGAR